jgi:DNA gyrase subunit B
MTIVDIKLLSFLECVRKRPGMYVGGTDGSGVLHVVLELVANALDQALAGRCTQIDISLDDDGSVTVSDDGPGISVEGDERRPSLVEILEWRSERATVDDHRPHVHLGLGAIGLAVANAVSDPFELVTVCDGQQATARYRGGVAIEPLRVEPTTLPSGTRVRVRPDPQIFDPITVPRDDLHSRLMDLSSLVPQIRLSWTNASPRHGQGLVELVKLYSRAIFGGVAHVRQEVETESGPIDVEVALAWRMDSRDAPHIHGFVNLARTRELGTHAEGLLDGIRSFFPRKGAAARRQGLVAAVSVILSDVRMGNPTRDKLITPAARGAVEQATIMALTAWAVAYPEDAASIHARGL